MDSTSSFIPNQTPSSVLPSKGVVRAILLLVFLSLGATLLAVPTIAAGETIAASSTWFSLSDLASQAGAGTTPFEVEVAWRVDGLSLLFLLLITGIGAIVLPYAATYFREHPYRTRVMVLLFAFLAAMAGMVVADDLLLMFVFWEVTTIVSYLLIGFDHQKADARAAALRALLITGAGGLAMLAGLLLLANAAGTFSISEILASGDVVREHPHYHAILVLVLLGALTKSAQVPFHFWLPGAMAAPTPISAYLHSATMVKAGIYLLARLQPTLGGTEAWAVPLILIGGATAILSGVLALRQTDLKLLLAYTTTAALGKLTLLLGLAGAGVTYAYLAIATFLLAHAFYKAALFLVIGVIDKATKTRDLRRLGGLYRSMPWLAGAAVVAAASKLGVIPMLGFVSKEAMYEAGLQSPILGSLVMTTLVIANVLMGAAAILVVYKPFFGRTPSVDHATPVHTPPRAMTIGPVLLGIGTVAAGIMVAQVGSWLLHAASYSIAGYDTGLTAYLWHGVNTALGLSVLTILLAFGIVSVHNTLRRAIDATLRRLPTGEQIHDALYLGMMGLARWQTRVLQHGSLRGYLLVILATLAALLVAALTTTGLPSMPEWNEAESPIYGWGIAAILAVSTIATVTASNRLIAIVALGGVGIGCALLFIVYGAPDVAMTQLLVDTLVVVIIALVLVRLPSLRQPLAEASGSAAAVRRRAFEVGRVVVALAVGATVTLMLLHILGQPLDRSISAYYESASVPEAKGRNIVNVILVDFRAIDTLGEITVVVLASIAGYALLRTRRRGEEAEAATTSGGAA